MIGFHILRNQTFLALLLICSIISFFTNVYRYYDMKRRDLAVSPVPSLDSIDWRIDTNLSKLQTGCQNSVQGSVLIVDEQGFVCSRQSLNINGCCSLGSHRFSCRSCQVNSCCSVYEYCVSCCLHPEKRSNLQRTFLRSGRSFPHLFSSASNVFEVCLAKCRTSSQSVQHENAYRDPHLKHCYGSDVPPIRIN